MEENKYGIILDGKMDEPIWDTVEAHTGFKKLTSTGGGPAPVETVFKVLPCADRVYFGVKCLEPEGMEQILEARYAGSTFMSSSVELFLSPSGTGYDIYQFLVSINEQTMCHYYGEEGNIQPDRFAPDWASAVHIGEDYWSAEIELPLTAFYWTSHERWSDKWLVNIARNRRLLVGGLQYSTWSDLQFRFLEPRNYNALSGFPMRPIENDVCIIDAVADLQEETADGYCGVMTVKTTNAMAGTFLFTSDRAESREVSLKAGSNEFTVPCQFEKLGRNRTELKLTRIADGQEFKRYYPVLATFEPIKLKLTLPEYRGNFYPGQDYSQIAGYVEVTKPVTLTLEGPGIKTTTVKLDASGNFRFETPDFEIGEAHLTVTIDGYELKKKIRRLAPTGHMMTWISGGNLIVDGKPTLRRDLYARNYRVGTACQRKYMADNLHETWLGGQKGHLEPRALLPKSEGMGGESTQDRMPSDEMLAQVDKMLEANKDNDFAYYYISDEPECRGLSPVYFKNLYNYVAEKDPYHVILCASRSAGANVDIADWFETHPYICPYNNADGSRVYIRPLHSLGKFVDDIVKLNRPDKCIGFLPTCYASGGAVNGWDYPTFDEYILHTWAAMIHGGKTLWPYAGHDVNDRAALYEGTRYIFSSFEALEDIVLFAKRTTLFRSTDAEAVLYDNGDEKMFVLVNLTQQPQTVTLDDLSGIWHEFRGSRTFTGNTFTLNPLETVIGTNVVKGADLPTYAEVKALIDEQEYKRTHTGSLFFDRAVDIALTSSGMKNPTRSKFFDGVLDDLGCYLEGNPDNFIELDLTKLKPAISKVVLHGYMIEEGELKLRVGDELVSPVVAETQVAEYAKTFILSETVTPDALRLEFQGKRVEIYEIEAF